ncbi:hypothetical protein K438DRAFT_1739344 [Mycena galopus ATCC 62051]|nr:hypothetical protein K438DRAFT_1739344 [Mycena galopus ATCC 62051]
MASPFAPRLGTNYCPTDKEVLDIADLLVEPTLRLKGIDDEIAKLQTAIDKLTEERDSLGAYVEAHQALISPARRLPLDIVQEIFIACLPTHRNCVMSAAEAPVLLGRICSSWRTISLSTPSLWARLHVVEPLFGPSDPTPASLDQKVERRLEITKTWLGRSGQCPLSISLQSAPEITPEAGTPTVASPNSVQFLQALISFAARWQHIHFTTPPSLLLEIMSYLDTDMPWLETVGFHHQATRPLHSTSGPWNMLRGVRISSFSIPGSIFMPEKLPLAWNQLTTLTVGGPSWTVSTRMSSEALISVLSLCPELRCCKLMVHDPNPEIAILQQHPIVDLPFLHTLAIHCIARVTSAVSDLLMRLSLPELRSFTVFGSAQDCPALGDFFANTIRLETLHIDINIFSKTSFLETLRALPPTLQRLQICDIDYPWGPPQTCLDDDTLTTLMSPGLCPVLRHLSIDHAFSISDEAVFRFISARMQESQTTLKRVDIDFGRQKAVDIIPDLEPFVEMGLAASLVYLPHPPSLYSPWQGLPDAPPVNWNPPSWGPPPTIGNW